MLLHSERALLESYAPGLDKTLDEIGLARLEQEDQKLLPGIIREARLPGLLVREDLGGAGCAPHDAIRIQRAIASRSPSLGIMATMHNFTISFCNLLVDAMPSVRTLLASVAREHKLVASGFAEGRFGAGILDSTLSLTRDGAGYRLSGSKKPCTMSHCMDILTAGVSQVGPDGRKRTGMAIVQAGQAGLSRHRFWNTPVLAAAGSHELRLDNVAVAADQVLIADPDSVEEQQLIAISEVIGLCWFEIIAAANYLGVASGLAERALANRHVTPNEVATLACQLEGAQAALDGAVRIMETGPFDESLLPRILMIRFSVQATIEGSAMFAAELAGGLAFVQGSEIGTLLAASRCLAFHPISRKAAEPMVAGFYAGSV